MAGQNFVPQQLDDVFLVIAATDDSALNAEVYAEAISAACWLTWWMTNRAAPLSSRRLSIAHRCGGRFFQRPGTGLARMLREKLEALLPASLGQMAELPEGCVAK
ncbi:Siroheme synthase [Serratia fonticola]|uniref:Siroheme synthase n=1 Tax=Serratia fonticola TaxID=47917 RepID=A0A4U9WG27_SERFO|nr:Siroheme synthase [Serratia fonticola]